mgnify:CR=1 FL=1
MGIKYSKTSNKKRVKFEFNADKILQPTYPASLVSIFSGAVAYANAPSPQMDAIDSVTLGIIVTAVTFLAAKIGKKIGARAGFWAGGVAGSVAGATIGSAAGALGGDKGEKAEAAAAAGVIGGAAVGLTAAAILSAVGYVGGFAGGAYAGHVYSKEASMKYFFNKPAAAQTQVINMPKWDVPAMIAAFRP